MPTLHPHYAPTITQTKLTLLNDNLDVSLLLEPHLLLPTSILHLPTYTPSARFSPPSHSAYPPSPHR